MISADEKKSIGLSALASVIAMCAVLMPVGWYLVKPVLVASVSTAMAEDLDDSIEQRLMPLNAGFKAILQQNINSLRRDIAEMNFRRDNDHNWTVRDANILAQMEIDLDGQLAALRAITSAETR